MPRPPEPWQRTDTNGAWYARIKGRKVWLAGPEATKTEAREIMIQALAAAKKEDRRVGGLTFRDVANLFTESVEARVKRKAMSPLTLEGYDRFLVPAVQSFGKHSVSALKAKHVQGWLDGEPTWNDTTRNNAITAVKACLNWARKMGHIEANPIRDMEKPRAGVTTDDLTIEKAVKILRAVTDQPFKDYLVVLWETGARPSEVMRIEAGHLDVGAEQVVMDSKTTRRTGDKRVIYLTPTAVDVLARRAYFHPDGALLRTVRGTPWTRHTVGQRFRRLRKTLGMGREATAKGFRHGFVTDALERGVPIATVAELVGHKGTKMVERHYSKLRERTEHLRNATRVIRPSLAPPSAALDLPDSVTDKGSAGPLDPG